LSPVRWSASASLCAAVPRHDLQGRGGVAQPRLRVRGVVRYIIKNLGMALEIGDSQEEVNVRHEEQLRWSPDASMCSMWEFLSPPFYFNSYPWRSHRNPNPLKKLILQTESKVFFP
jgi:hypothetical protein